LYATRSFFSAKNKVCGEKEFRPPVSILKPVKGLDWQAYENFASMCTLDYSRYEIIFAVADENDPAVNAIERLQREFPKVAIHLIVGVEQLGRSHKTNSLCRLVREAKYDVLVMNDSDVRVEKDYLREVVAPLRDPRVGVVTSLFHTKTDGSFAADMDAVGIPGDAGARAIVAHQFGRLDFAFGWTMATTKHVLAELGGFEALCDMHSDDFALGNEAAKKGYRIELTRKPVCMVFAPETLREFLAHELRWSIQFRKLRPLGYLGVLLTFGFLWAVLVAVLAPSWRFAAGYCAAYASLRGLVAWKMGVQGLGDATLRRKPWLVFARDALQFGVYVASFWSDSVSWRGAEYKLSGPFLEPKQVTHSHVVVKRV
jgi:ceramide glucosyltransferase